MMLMSAKPSLAQSTDVQFQIYLGTPSNHTHALNLLQLRLPSSWPRGHPVPSAAVPPAVASSVAVPLVAAAAASPHAAVLDPGCLLLAVVMNAEKAQRKTWILTRHLQVDNPKIGFHYQRMVLGIS